MPRKNRNADDYRKRAVIGDTRPTTIGDALDLEVVESMRKSVVRAKRAAKRAERQANVDRYNARMARRSIRRGGRRDG